jgi:hypothetical protein
LYSITLNNTADTVADIQWQIHSGRNSARYTVPDQDIHSQGQIHRGEYTAVDIQRQKQWQIYNTANTVADTKWWIYSGGYREVVQDTQHDINGGGYTAADTQQRIHSGR